MAFNLLKKVFVIIFSLIISKSKSFPNVTITNQNEVLSESRQTIQAIDKTLNYIQNQPKALKIDVIFGVILAKANLKWITTHLKTNPAFEIFWSEEGSKLMKKCDAIANALQTSLDTPFLKVKFWEDGAEDLVFGTLQKKGLTFVSPEFDSCQSINSYMRMGTPNNSDFCISELYKSRCIISDYCWFSEMNDEYHSGYKTSHRLIYLQIAAKLHCEKINSEKFHDIYEKKKILCQQMLLEASALHSEKHFSMTRDLFMEQIALCGYEGYEEFAPKIWRDEIRSWQNQKGCFGHDLIFNCSDFTVSKHNKRRNKRSDFVVDNCHTHVTAVALSSMAFHLRFLLVKAFS